jgi:hypothetical protein
MDLASVEEPASPLPMVTAAVPAAANGSPARMVLAVANLKAGRTRLPASGREKCLKALFVRGARGRGLGLHGPRAR